MNIISSSLEVTQNNYIFCSCDIDINVPIVSGDSTSFITFTRDPASKIFCHFIVRTNFNRIYKVVYYKVIT